jgi:hypothetical protein
MAVYTVTTAGTALEFDTQDYWWGTHQLIDSDHFLTMWSGYNARMYAQVLNVNSSTWAITTANSSLDFNTANINQTTCSSYKIDTNHFIVFHMSDGLDGYAQVLTVNTSTWAVTTASASLEFDTVIGYEPSNYKVDTNHLIVFWGGSGTDGFVQILEVNTTTWAISTSAASLEFDTQDCRWNSCSQIDSNHFVNFWTGNGDDGFVQVFEVNTSTWAVTTASASLEFNTQSGLYNSCEKIDTSHFINVFLGGSPSNAYAQVFAVNTSTWAITTAASFKQFFPSYSAPIDFNLSKVNDNHFICFFAASGLDGYAQVLTVNTSTWAITTASASFEFDTQQGRFNSSIEISSGKFINSWQDTSGDGQIQVFDVALPGLATNQKNLLLLGVG